MQRRKQNIFINMDTRLLIKALTKSGQRTSVFATRWQHKERDMPGVSDKTHKQWCFMHGRPETMTRSKETRHWLRKKRSTYRKLCLSGGQSDCCTSISPSGIFQQRSTFRFYSYIIDAIQSYQFTAPLSKTLLLPPKLSWISPDAFCIQEQWITHLLSREHSLPFYGNRGFSNIITRVHYRTLREIIPAHILTTRFSQMYWNIILVYLNVTCNVFTRYSA